MQLSRAFRIQPHEIVAFVGGGGKTTGMFRLADELHASGKRVVITTTTRMGVTQTNGLTPLRYEDTPGFRAHLLDVLRRSSRALVIGEDVDGEKIAGVPPALIDELAKHSEIDAVVYEADGARGLPFKAPASHEPVIAEATTLLVPVFGITALGKPLDDAHVHRAEIVARLAGAQLGDIVTSELAARMLTHDEGALKNMPSHARAIALVNQVEDALQLETARVLARELLRHNAIEAAALGAVAHAQDPIAETHRRVAAIVLAAGGGTRMNGRVKQLLPWGDKTLIENAVELATKSDAYETLIVLGAHADVIKPVIGKSPVRIVLNPDWEAGHATSMRAGLDALAPEIAAAVFINADQPLLTVQVVNSLIRRYYETDAPILTSVFAGRRASPALFDRQHFSELQSLQGEQGGRELLNRFQVRRVEFDDANYGADIDTWDEYERLVRRKN